MNIFLILVFFAVFFAFTWRRIEQGISILVIALPLYVVRFSLFGLPSTLLEGMILILFCVWLIQQHQKLKEKIQFFQMNTFLAGSIFLFVAASCVSVFVAPHIYPALGLWRAYIFEPILFFLVFSDTIRTKEQMTRVIIASIVSGCSIALYGIFQKITGFGIPDTWVLERRITSIYPYPNAVGLYLAPIVMICGALLIYLLSVIPAKVPDLSTSIRAGINRNARGAGIHGLYKFFSKKYSTIAVLSGALIILLAAIVFAKTEAALLALGVSGVIFGFFWSLRSRRATILFCVFAIFFISISSPLVKIVDEKLFLKDWSGTVRKSIWKETLPMIRDNWILGAGLSGYQERIKPYHKTQGIEIFQYPHNIILNFWSEMGIVGLVAFEALVGWYFFILARALFILRKTPAGDERSFLQALAFGCFFAMMTIVIHGLVDVPYFKNDLAVFFWMLMGLAVVVYTRTQEIKSS
ncbi:O-antigen ligase family protein [Candidatus Uhrbacteria bacterium]|nr:O-antigen ligase family protein [Candidatus Uhrbacteria bacterium]